MISVPVLRFIFNYQAFLKSETNKHPNAEAWKNKKNTPNAFIGKGEAEFCSVLAFEVN